MRKKIRSIHIILFVMLFLIGSFIDISTIHAEAGSRTGSIQIIYKGRNSSDKEVILSGAKFSIFPIQYMKNDELVWEDGFKDSDISLQDTSTVKFCWMISSVFCFFCNSCFSRTVAACSDSRCSIRF